MSDSAAVNLLEQYVQLLNASDAAAISSTFAPDYLDYDPLWIPQLLPRPPEGVGSLEYLTQFVALLAAPFCDFYFSLEDNFGSGQKVAYRLFGHGVVAIRPDNSPSDERTPLAEHDSTLQSVEVAGSGVTVFTHAANRLSLSSTEVSLTFTCTGIFSIQDSKLSRRWGSATLQ